MSAAPIPRGVVPPLVVYSWWRLPSQQIVEVRRLLTVDGHAECVVRNVNDDAELAPWEYTLTLRFLRAHAKPVMRAGR